MTNSHLFVDRLVELGSSAPELMEHIDASPDEAVIGYTSQIDSFGTTQSDLDLYVFTERAESVRMEQVAVGHVTADIEYYPLAQLNYHIRSLEEFDLNAPDAMPLDSETAKLLYRIHVSAVLQGQTQIDLLRQRISLQKLSAMYARWARMAVDRLADNAVRFYEAGDYISSVLVGRKAFDAAVQAYLAKRSIFVFKPKWTYVAMQKHLGANHELHQAFLRYHFRTTPEDARRTAEEMIRHWEEIISDIE